MSIMEDLSLPKVSRNSQENEGRYFTCGISISRCGLCIRLIVNTVSFFTRASLGGIEIKKIFVMLSPAHAALEYFGTNFFSIAFDPVLIESRMLHYFPLY